MSVTRREREDGKPRAPAPSSDFFGHVLEENA